MQFNKTEINKKSNIVSKEKYLQIINVLSTENLFYLLAYFNLIQYWHSF